MDALVLNQRRVVAEALPAGGAGVGLLTSVDDLVLDEVRAAAEALAAVCAGVGFLTCVRASVRHQMGVPAKALATLLAFVGLLAGITIKDKALLAALRGTCLPFAGFLCEASIGQGCFQPSLLWGARLPIVFGSPQSLAAGCLPSTL